jgi:crotonobetainyl-CoA:carnitine CoA-transferase CaiB-like acyl-CoA transferase
VELGGLIAGPFAGRLLADHGADVIKVEPPQGDGDPLRTWSTRQYRDMSVWWFVQSRNKRLVTLDLRRPEGQDVLRRLLARTDVLLENFRPGTLERWNLAPDDLLALNPRLVICRVSGYGQSGPYSGRPGFAAGAEAMSGMRYVNGYPDQPPPRTGLAIGDSLASMLAVIGLLMALHRREVTGLGQVVDAAILDSCIAVLDGIIPEYGTFGAVRQPTGTGMEHAAPSNIFQTRDGTWILIAATADKLFRALCGAMGQPALADDPDYATNEARVVNRLRLERIIADWAAGQTAAGAGRILLDAGVVTTPINDVAAMGADPHVRARELLTTVDTPEAGPVLMPNVVPGLSASPGRIRWPGPWPKGAQNTEVLGDLAGLEPGELTRLAEQGVI